MMNGILDKPVLEQIYEYKKEDFEQKLLDTNPKCKDILNELCEKSLALENYIKQIVSNKEECSEAIKMLEDINMTYCKQVDVWSHEYYRLGFSDVANIKSELKNLREKEKQNKDFTFLDFTETDFNEYVNYHGDYTSEEYKKLLKEYNKISESYPNVIKVYEDLKPVVLTKEETEQLIELIKIEMDMSNYSEKICFKLGMDEVLNLID